MDFREHPVAHLIAELIETHNRNKFEIYGFSFGVITGDAMRKRLEGAFDKFLEVRSLSELSIARLARDHEIDIAIDLGGYTQDSKSAIFAHRAAPIQIIYLGFPGTMGTEHLDYFIGDRITVSDTNLENFSEKVIFLPNSFQVNPNQRPIGPKNPSRAAHGIPDDGFVFCCFNNVWKITPYTFELWARILQQVEGSVLWLQNDDQTVPKNLSKAFESAGISVARMIFASKIPSLSDHLDRYRLADLFLDTFPYGAHTTASDALWAGLPVLTRSGQSFASRVAGSLLHSVGLPELITHTMEEYESLAIELAKNPEKIASLKARLAENRATCPLFNTALFTQHIESAYQVAYDRYHDGLAPDHIYVGS
jgi:predicted O-linked N-acetylglucosamine transferase (SPINDLY family)